jgi:hypothetical protein
LVILVASALTLIAAASLDYVNHPLVPTNGGGQSSSPTYTSTGIAGQLIIGVASSINYINSGGFDAITSGGGAGTVLISDSFTEPDGPPVNWTILSGTWAVNSNALEHQSAAVPGVPESILSNGPTTANAWFEIAVTVSSGTPLVSLVFRAASATLIGPNQYWVLLDYATGSVRFLKDVAGAQYAVASASYALRPNSTHTLKVKSAGNEFRVLVDGVQSLCVTDGSLSQSGYYGLRVESGSLVSFDNFTAVTASNTPPVANAGADQNVSGSRTVLLNGTGSSDGDGDPINFLWTQSGGPPVTLSNSTSAAPSFHLSESGSYVFQHIVDDCLTTSAPVTTVVTASVPKPIGDGRRCGLLGLEGFLVPVAFGMARWFQTVGRTCGREKVPIVRSIVHLSCWAFALLIPACGGSGGKGGEVGGAPQTTTWTWDSGANVVGELGVYGSQGMAASPNVPGARGLHVLDRLGGPSRDLWGDRLRRRAAWERAPE